MYFGYSKALGVTTSTAVLALSLLAPLPAAEAASVAATGTDAAICNQEVSDNTNVTSVRLAGGDCVITFTAGTTVWTPPSNLRSIKFLIVGGGGGGGSSYNNGGAGGGGAGQVFDVARYQITRSATYSIAIGDGGAGGALVVGGDNYGASGENSSFTYNVSGQNVLIQRALGGVGGTGRNAINPLNSGIAMAGGAAATATTAALGGNRGGGGAGGGGGGGSSGAGTNGSAGAATNGGNGGTGSVSSITNSSVTYGTGGNGGKTISTPADASANTGNGGSGSASGNSTQVAGAKGGSGVVIIRYSTAVPVFSNISIAGTPTTATYRASNTISATVDVPSLITFFAGKTRIAGCVSVATSGSGSNNTATCSWKPNLKGAQVITAEASPVAAGIAGTSTISARIAVVARSTRR